MPFLLYSFLLNKGLERREAQERFFDIVSHTIENGGISIIQAPTGTGKTYGYLIPILEKGQKAIISTGTKLLQEQLRRDIETLKVYHSYLTGESVDYLILKGKNNYLCLDRFYQQPPDKRPSQIEDLLESEWDGDWEFVQVDVELWKDLCVEDDYCTSHYRSICKYSEECYYWSKLKRREKNARIIVVNHALLALKEFENPEDRLLVIDEAHELDKYVTSSLTDGVSTYTLRVEIMERIVQFLPDAQARVEEFFERHFSEMFDEETQQKPLQNLAPYLKDFEELIIRPISTYHKRIKEKLISEIGNYLTSKLWISLKLKDYLQRSSLLNWEEYFQLNVSFDEPTEEEERVIKKLKTYELLEKKIQRLKDFYKVMKSPPADVGFSISRKWSSRLKGFNYRLERFPVFPAGYFDLSGYKGVIITSATVDPEDLYQTMGIVGEFYDLPHTFPYHRVEFVVYNANPKEKEEWELCLKLAYKKLRTLHDRVLALLTNKEQLNLFRDEEGIALQGEDKLSLLVEALRKGEIKALVGLDSLWFGIDVKGEKGILMAKLPFDSPEDPLTYHRIRYLKEIGEEPFEYQKMKALIKFRQGLGRMMRSSQDFGTIILCDRRIFKFKEFRQAVEDLGMKIKYIKHV
ncbi:ATP-dependent DNA helicase [Thermocrinis sp.]|uniref:ATP-dependent DNA helicase n=1 Tax=Thermocrinis sp. TaxID=2024383 RepID=UPI002FDCA58F